MAAALLAALFATAPAAAQEPAAAAGERPAGRGHVVRPGETLWELARQYYNDPYRWPVIYEANRWMLRSPHLIYPDERLVIPGLGPETGVEVALEGELPIAQVGFGRAIQREELAGEAAAQARTRFYRTGADQGAGPTLLIAAPEVAPPVQADEFQATAWLADSAALEVVGQVIGVLDPRAGKSKLSESAHPFDRLALSYGAAPAPQVGDRLVLVRVGREIPGWGRIIHPQAILTVASRQAQAMGAVVSKQFGEVKAGSLALSPEPFPELPNAAPQPVEDGAQGEVVGFVVEQPLYGPSDAAFISLGRAHGLAIGDELIAYIPERPVEADGSHLMPPEPVARLRVIRVGERTGTVRILRVTSAALAVGLPVRVIRKMP
ncbi:MAG: LysM peptidoglycan-binding domain-containing protein [Gemmatimonadetes bacterium]|nr:LysM peptidoglycan-binding domain-containing protein [Gemmatimonadota bacterium]